MPTTRSIPMLSSITLTFTAVLGCATVDDPESLGPASEPPMLDLSTIEGAQARALAILDAQREDHLADVDEVWIEDTRIDPWGHTHTRVTQTLDQIPVFGAGAVVHTDAHGAFTELTDGLVHDLAVDTTPRLSARAAIDRAVDATGGTDGLSSPPWAELRILRRAAHDHLTYQVHVPRMQPGSEPTRPVVFIDAHTGALVWHYDDLYRWTLKKDRRVTYDTHGSTKLAAATVGDSSDPILLQAHDSVTATLKFLHVRAGRDSYDDAGATIHTYGHYGDGYLNAFWDGSGEHLVLGDGDGVNFGPFGVPDIVAHEIGHAIVTYEAGLVNAGESGALAETTGDIMGAAVADFIGDDWVFDIGEDCWLPTDPSVALRTMGHPSDDGSSRDHYSDRYQGEADNGGIHFNSGIGNHFFYLLSQGGQHHDPAFRSGHVIDGIGIESAFEIWYRALTVYMVPSTDFADARLATVKAADDLYGAEVAHQVATAWFEVGVGGEPI
ncbi:MAG: M4 family metallopeptidase [Myxococcota bacterium]